MTSLREAFFGEFRVSLPRTLAARHPERVTVSRGFRICHPGHIEFAGPDARLRCGTHAFGFARGDHGGLLRLEGTLELRGNVQVGVGASWVVGEGARLVVGARTYFSPDTRIVAMNGITVGDDCAISWDVQLLDEDFHEVIVDGDIRPTGAPISIGNHVWIGSRATVLKGAVVPDDTTIASGAVVSGVHRDRHRPRRVPREGRPARDRLDLTGIVRTIDGADAAITPDIAASSASPQPGPSRPGQGGDGPFAGPADDAQVHQGHEGVSRARGVCLRRLDDGLPSGDRGYRTLARTIPRMPGDWRRYSSPMAIDWGDVPTWIAGFGAVVALFFARRAANSAKEASALQGEELTQLKAEIAQRDAQHQRALASKVDIFVRMERRDVETENGPLKSAQPVVQYVNTSGMPVYELTLYCFSPGVILCRRYSVVGPPSGEKRDLRLIGERLAELFPKTETGWLIDAGKIRATCAFRDAEGGWWCRDRGLLVAAGGQTDAEKKIDVEKRARDSEPHGGRSIELIEDIPTSF